ncbi:LA2681 family HEPN domain-containing protein [Desulfococcaceae bacterium HSG9]|nr:LA2681 family HEPN domain-containing protein [Desulfococcaceae bacterium HSG9]
MDKKNCTQLILNRIKSEFALARILYYQSNPECCKGLETFDEEIAFTELYENEAVGIRPEMVRLSFRICFGILDKIARGICDLFNLAEPNEPLYFESFWKPRGNKSIKQKERWDKINSINNFPLLALYSQATDLNSFNGEWGIFKEWRNAMEHKMLISHWIYLKL